LNDSLTGDTASGGQGGSADGGGVYIGGGSLNAINSTIAENSVANGGTGGGVDVAAGATASLYNTLVALNTEGTGGSAQADDIAGTVNSASAYNLIGTGGSGGLANNVNGNQIGVVNPGLDPEGLQGNGGPTQTIALLPGSPAIGQGSAKIAGVSVPATDERGIGRPSNYVDVGAFQDRGFAITIVAGESPQATAINTAFDNPLAVFVSSPFGDPVQGGVINFAVTPSSVGAAASLSAGSAAVGAGGLSSVTAVANGTVGSYDVSVSALGVATPPVFTLSNLANAVNVTAVTAGWGTHTVALETAADGIRLLPWGRSSDLPWLGIQRVQITVATAAALAAADVKVSSATGVNYGPVTVSGSGVSYTITLAQPINHADRVTITIANATIATFTRRLDVLPGDVNDDGIVNSQDLVLVRNMWLRVNGAQPTIFGDINGDGVVNSTDYNDVRMEIGTALPPPSGDPPGSGGSGGLLVLGAAAEGTPPVVSINPRTTKTPGRPAAPAARPRAEIELARRGRGWILGQATRTKLVNQLKLVQV
jgi:hypothetical protein